MIETTPEIGCTDQLGWTVSDTWAAFSWDWHCIVHGPLDSNSMCVAVMSIAFRVQMQRGIKADAWPMTTAR